MQHILTIDQAISTLLLLMTRYSLAPEIATAELIERHLQQLVHHPDNQSPAIQEICRSLSQKWHSITEYQYFQCDGIAVTKAQ